jgi:hypothetical protein
MSTIPPLSQTDPMSKLPMESRPLRLAPEVAKVVERRLQPLTGKKLEAAQDAVLKVYQSGQQMALDQWVQTYDQAISAAVKEP